MSAKERVRARIESARDRWPALDHAVRTQQHYSRVNAASQAGAVTYFAFLSFFPLLALAFFVVGYIARYFPEARHSLVESIEQVFPGMIGGPNGISLDAIQRAVATVGIIGVVTLTYSGLGWLSGMRTALRVVFELSLSTRPSFFVGKLRDLVTLAVVGTTLLVSVALSGVATRFSAQLLDALDLDRDLSWGVAVAAVSVAMAANTLLFFVLFTVLARPRIPRRSLWQGALLGSVAFEVLKQLSSYLLAVVHRSPAFQAFGTALILLVWINYFSRLVMYAAAWAWTTPAASAERAAQEQSSSADPPPLGAVRGQVSRTPVPGFPVLVDVAADVRQSRRGRTLDPRLAFAAGAAVALGTVAIVRRRRD
jgi:membrane protein